MSDRPESDGSTSAVSLGDGAVFALLWLLCVGCQIVMGLLHPSSSSYCHVEFLIWALRPAGSNAACGDILQAKRQEAANTMNVAADVILLDGSMNKWGSTTQAFLPLLYHTVALQSIHAHAFPSPPPQQLSTARPRFPGFSFRSVDSAPNDNPGSHGQGSSRSGPSGRRPPHRCGSPLSESAQTLLPRPRELRRDDLSLEALCARAGVTDVLYSTTDSRLPPAFAAVHRVGLTSPYTRAVQARRRLSMEYNH